MIPRHTHTLQAGTLELHAESFEGDGPAIVLIMGLGAQMLLWPDGFCECLAQLGHRVIRFDNRDVGLSSRLSHLGRPDLVRNLIRSRLGRRIDAPYTLSDMAHDTLDVMDHFRLDRPVIVGASMGGMIAQRLAILAPDRIGGLVSMMSTTTAWFYPKPRTLLKLLRRPAPGKEAYIEHIVSMFRVMGTQTFEQPEAELRELAAKMFDRGPSPGGFLRHFAAILEDGDRGPALHDLQIPRLVIHGDEDSLIPLQVGRRSADVMSAPLRIIQGMGHDLPRRRWDEICAEISKLALGVG